MQCSVQGDNLWRKDQLKRDKTIPSVLGEIAGFPSGDSSLVAVLDISGVAPVGSHANSWQTWTSIMNIQRGWRVRGKMGRCGREKVRRWRRE